MKALRWAGSKIALWFDMATNSAAFYIALFIVLTFCVVGFASVMIDG